MMDTEQIKQKFEEQDRLRDTYEIRRQQQYQRWLKQQRKISDWKLAVATIRQQRSFWKPTYIPTLRVYAVLARGNVYWLRPEQASVWQAILDANPIGYKLHVQDDWATDLDECLNGHMLNWTVA